jgi:hypothetical protein
LVFIDLNFDSFNTELANINTHDGAVALRHRFGLVKKSVEDEEVVILSSVLDAPVNTGFEFLRGHPVDEFDGVKVRNIKHLSQLWHNCAGTYVRIRLLDATVVVLDRELAVASEKEVLSNHNVPWAERIGGLTEESRCCSNLTSLAFSDDTGEDAATGDSRDDEKPCFVD